MYLFVYEVTVDERNLHQEITAMKLIHKNSEWGCVFAREC